jgi:hypothetical protein
MRDQLWRGLRHGAISPFSPAELFECGVKIAFIKIGPHAIREQKLGVSRFPKQKVREALLAAGANQEIHLFGLGAQSLLQKLSKRVRRSGLSIREDHCGSNSCARDGVARRVVDGHADVDAISSGGCVLGLFDLMQDRLCQPVSSAYDLESRATLAKPASFESQEGAEQPEDALHLGRRAAPVVGGESVQGQATNPSIERALYNAADSGHSGTMARYTG